jgi:hypothetical protein
MLHKQIQIICDTCGALSAQVFTSAVEAKRQLRTEGWRFRNGIHTCPTGCSANRTNTRTMEAHTPAEVEHEEEI